MIRTICLLIIGCLVMAGPVAGDAEPQPAATNPAAPASQPVVDEERHPEPFMDLAHNHRLTGDWDGLRTDVEDIGLEFNLQLTSVYQHNVHGGLRTFNGNDINGRVDTELKFSTEPAGLWKGGTLYVYSESGWNDGIGNRVGDLFGLNGSALGDEEIRIRELWYEQAFLDEMIRVKLGKYDPAVEIDTNAFANYEITQFFNNALVNTGNIPLPDYGLGAILSVTPFDWLYATAVVADAQANGNQTGLHTTFHDEDYFFFDFELGLLPVWKTPWGNLPGGYRIGLWYDPQPKAEFFDDLDGRRRTIPHKRDDTGFYVNLDQLVFKEKPQDDIDTQGLGLFFRYGYAPAEVNEIEHFWSVGGQYQGLVPTRDNDVLGIGFAQGILSRRLQPLESRTRESVCEMYYSIEVAPWCHVSPDLQYIVNPSGGGSRDSLALGLRVQMAF